MATEGELQEAIRTLGKRLGIPDQNIEKALAGKDKATLRAIKGKWARGLSSKTRDIHSAKERQWSTNNALRAEDTHSKFKETNRATIKWQRANTSIPERLATVLSKGRLLESNARTSSLTASRAGESEEVGPPGAFQDGALLDLTPLKMIERYLEDLEAQVDALSGVGPAIGLKTPAARNARLREFDGIHSRVTGEYFGYSQRTIEVWRSELAAERGETISPSTGLPK